ncbi:hypothetical protein KSS87_022758 [Heliosperma pusillum]|nr:hypothetical protein KSS87_022758 [Heliosperma pusillum]
MSGDCWVEYNCLVNNSSEETTFKLLWFCRSKILMALRRAFGWSDGDLMRSDCKPCTRLMRQTAGISTVGGALAFWVLCRLHYGSRVTIPRSLRWAACGAASVSSSTALLVRLLSPECEPQNIAAYDNKK